MRHKVRREDLGIRSSLEETAAAKTYIVHQESVDVRCSFLRDSEIHKYALTLMNCNTSLSSALPHRMRYVRFCKDMFQKPEKLLLLYCSDIPGFSRRNILL